uniref:Uncharacterized protein n=1 Tax=Entomoneis paludosa TaxID=265537 RepID=A0A7S3DVN3_9STRA
MVRMLFQNTPSLLLSNNSKNEDPALQETSSTVTVTGILKQQQSKSPSKRAVGFSKKTTRFVYKKPSVSTDDLWYSNEEFAQFKVDFKQDAKAVARSAKKSDSGNQAVLEVFDECQRESLPSPSNPALQAFLQDATHTGLERMAAREIFADKGSRRKALYRALRQVQGLESSALLRTTFEQVSRPSVLFAHCIATAAAASS